jgi:hypothetical protein
MKKTLLFICSVWALCVAAQVTPTPNPIPKGYTGQVTITFDATKGNGGMIGATKCYAHTGLITSASTSNSDWKNVIGSWRGATQPQLTSLGDNKWQLVISNIFDFYGVPETTNIKALAFVFHDGPGGSKEGKATSGDIILTLGEEIIADIWTSVDGVTAVTKARPSGIDQGIYYDESDPTKVTLCTYAASKTESAKRVFLIGDMTNWKLDAAHQLYKDGNYFWITLTGLTPGKEYRFQYAVERADGVKKQISDLYSEKVIHPDDQYEPRSVNSTLISYPTQGADGGYVTVIQTNKPKYTWGDHTLNFQRPNRNNLVIYELWIYDYTTNRSLKGLMNRLDYIQNLGVNAIELMPVTEFDGNYNWGYSPNHYFALDKAYGTPEMFKQFVDQCHLRGIAVILDMVFNHATGLNPMNKLYPYGTDLASNPWFNVTPPHGDNVYEDWNHDFQPAHNMFIRALQYWLTEYKVDGFRLDLSHGLCGPSYNATANLIDYYQKGVKAVAPDAYMILEHWGDHMSSDRPYLVSYGMMCWNNTNNAYCQTAMGWLKDGDDFGSANQDNYISYCESHDEERMQYKAKKYGNGDIATDEAVRLGRVAENVAFNVLLNGPHMLWMWEEIGYDFSINSDIDHPNGESSDYRCSKKPRPDIASRNYFTQAERVAAFTTCAQVITLRTQLMPSVFAGNPTAANIGSGAALRSVQWGNNVYAVANFSATDNQSATLPSGTWYDYLNGATPASSSYSLAPGELKVFTGTAVQAPTFADIQTRDHTALEVVEEDAPRATKILRDGRVYIVRGDRMYDLTGRICQ